jgi:hypothetical protein
MLFLGAVLALGLGERNFYEVNKLYAKTTKRSI